MGLLKNLAFLRHGVQGLHGLQVKIVHPGVRLSVLLLCKAQAPLPILEEVLVSTKSFAHSCSGAFSLVSRSATPSSFVPFSFPRVFSVPSIATPLVSFAESCAYHRPSNCVLLSYSLGFT